MFRSSWLLLAVLFLIVSGCSGPGVTGGTPGVLRFGGEPGGDLQVTVHQAAGSAFEPIGFGVTRGDGTFELVTNGAQGPLELSPGEYRCTVESVGAEVEIPKEYTAAATTPLKVQWTGDGTLELDVPSPQAP